MSDKAKKPPNDAEMKVRAISRWNNEGGAPASGDVSTRKRPKRPRDPVQLAKLIVDIAADEVEERDPDEGKDPAAAAMGRKGGAARAAPMDPERRAEIAKKAAETRWKRP